MFSADRQDANFICFPLVRWWTNYLNSPKRSPAVWKKDGHFAFPPPLSPPLLSKRCTIMASNSKSDQCTRKDATGRYTHTQEESEQTEECACAAAASASELWRENVKAPRDLGERIWLHLCPIKQLAGSMGTPNIYLYFGGQLTSVCLWIYDFKTILDVGVGEGREKKGASRQSRWLITKADRDGRQTHTRIRTWIDGETRFGDGEQRSGILTHSLWQ